MDPGCSLDVLPTEWTVIDLMTTVKTAHQVTAG